MRNIEQKEYYFPYLLFNGLYYFINIINSRSLFCLKLRAICGLLFLVFKKYQHNSRAKFNNACYWMGGTWSVFGLGWTGVALGCFTSTSLPIIKLPNSLGSKERAKLTTWLFVVLRASTSFAKFSFSVLSNVILGSESSSFANSVSISVVRVFFVSYYQFF